MSFTRLFVLGWLLVGAALAAGAVGIAFNAQPVQAADSNGDNSKK